MSAFPNGPVNLGITGASGAPYAVRLLRALNDAEVPVRLSGVMSKFIRAKRGSALQAYSTIGVSITPGARTLVRMPRGPYCAAICFDRATMPPLAAE